MSAWHYTIIVTAVISTFRKQTHKNAKDKGQRESDVFVHNQIKNKTLLTTE